jgi:hypothetical protein
VSKFRREEGREQKRQILLPSLVAILGGGRGATKCGERE